MLRALVSSAPKPRHVLQPACPFRKTSTLLLKLQVKDVKCSIAPVLQARIPEMRSKRCIYEGSNRNILHYWKSAAFAVSGCGALGLLDEQHPTACASSNGNNEDPVERARKKMQELSTVAIAQLAALLPEDSNLKKWVDESLVSGTADQISWGFCMGACAGFTLKKVSKLGALAIGALYVLLQCANYSGYLKVNRKKLERDVKDYLDLDQDGESDTKDLDLMYKSVVRVLEFGFPAGSAFAAGFIIGFRSG